MRSRSQLAIAIVALAVALTALGQARRTPEQLQALSRNAETKGLAQPFRGVTTDGVVQPGLFAIRSTGVSTEPVRLAANTWLADTRAEYVRTGRAAAERLGLPAPEGGTFLFFDVAAHLDDRGLAGFLERCADRGLLLAPGTSFGPYPTWVRLCFTAVDPARALRGVDVLAELLSSSS